ncbi:hypothetical protein ABZ716_01725 [Streptomyces sp. NPDC006687]|uniref:hypothetical protein n=1 Tax=unclassified Streptomyces TaxID=2593676 RepID=UPI0033E6CF78
MNQQPQPFWTRRLFVFAASTVIAAGSALLNVAAFAAVHGTPHVAAGGQQWQCITAPCNPPDGAGKDGPPGSVPSGHEWQCIKAPCGPPDGGRPHHVWECFVAPCTPPDEGFPPPNPAPVGTPAAPLA